MSELEPFENQSKVTQVELIRVIDKYDPYGCMLISSYIGACCGVQCVYLY